VRIVLGPERRRGAISGRIGGWPFDDPWTARSICEPVGSPDQEISFDVMPDGSFEIGELDAGRYELRVEHGNLEYGGLLVPVPTHRGRTVVEVPPGGRAEGILLRPGRISYSFACVRVLSSAGHPVSGDVRVGCTSFVPWTPTAYLGGGRCVIPLEMPSGTEVHVRAVPRGPSIGLPATAKLRTSPTRDGEPVDLRLGEPTRLVVEVLGPDGPLDPREDGVRWTLDQEGKADNQLHRGFASVRSWSWETDPTVEGAVPPDRPFTLRVEAEGYGSFRSLYGPPGPGEKRVTVPLVPEAGVSLRLATPAGTSVTQARIEVRVISEVGAPVEKRLVCDASGRFEGRGLPPGSAMLTAVCRYRRLRGSLEFDLEPGQEKDLGTLTLRPVEPIRGRVLGPDGRPATGIAVGLRTARGTEYFEGRTASGPGGRFELYEVPAEDSALELFDGEGTILALLRVGATAAGEPIEVRLRERGEIVALLPDPPCLLGTELFVTTADGIGLMTNWREIEAAEGRLAGYRLFPVPPGEYTVRFEGIGADGGALRAAGEVTVSPGGCAEVLLRRLR
jgi:hypothetical protein